MLHAALSQWLLLQHTTLLLQKFCHFVQLLLHIVFFNIDIDVDL